MNAGTVLTGGAVVAALVLAAVLYRSSDGTAAGETPVRNRAGATAAVRTASDDGAEPSAPAEAAAAAAGEAEPVPSEEELREREEDRRVEAFDAAVDKWMDTEKNGPPTTKESVAFGAMFRGLPANRKQECLQRALNLVPDENAMLLAGILMDETSGKEYQQMIFHDVLNRDEKVKAPILRALYADRNHACHDDAAWILEATGEVVPENREGADER